METMPILFDCASLYGGCYFDIAVGKPSATPSMIRFTRPLVFHDIEAIIDSKGHDVP